MMDLDAVRDVLDAVDRRSSGAMFQAVLTRRIPPERRGMEYLDRHGDFSARKSLERLLKLLTPLTSLITETNAEYRLDVICSILAISDTGRRRIVAVCDSDGWMLRMRM